MAHLVEDSLQPGSRLSCAVDAKGRAGRATPVQSISPGSHELALFPKHELAMMLQGFRHGQFLLQLVTGRSSEKKKADAVEHPEAFQNVGLLVNEPSGTTSLLFNQSSGELE